MKKLSVSKVKLLIDKTGGNVSAMARAAGVVRSAIQQYIGSRPALQEALLASRQELVDNAETGLASAVAKGEAWAICFTLKCLAKERGYIERSEHVGTLDLTSGGKSIEPARDITVTVKQYATAVDALLARALPGLPPPNGDREYLDSRNGTGTH